MADLERAKEILTLWTVDPTKAVDGVKKVAKEIREETKLERDLDLVRKELSASTNRMDAAMRSLSSSMSGLGMSSSALAGGIGGLVATIGGKLVSAIGDAVKKLDAFVDRGDDFNDTVGENRDSVWAMTKAAQHMGEAMDVAKFRARIMASEGLRPTQEDLEALTRAASHMAHKQKTDWLTAADALADAWQSGRVRGIKPLNFEIDENINLVGKQVQILEQSTKLEKVRLSQAAEEKALLKERNDAYLHLSSTMNDNDVVAALMNFRQVDRIKNEIAWVQSLERGYERVSKFWAKYGGGDVGALKEGSFLPMAPFKGGFGVNEAPTFEEAADVIEGKTKFGAKKEKSGGAAIWKQNTAKAQSELQRWIDSTLRGKEDREYDEIKRGWESRDRDIDLKHEQALKRKIDLLREEGEARDKLEEQQRVAIDLLKQHNAEMEGMATGALANFTAGLWAAADAAIMGGDSMAVAIGKMLKATMLSIAQESTIKALFNIAEAAAQWYNPYAVSEHLRAAAIYGATAVAAGSVGLAMSAAGVGASAGGGGSSAGARGYSSPGATPSIGHKTEDKRPININVYLGDKGAPSNQLLMVKQIEVAMRKAA